MVFPQTTFQSTATKINNNNNNNNNIFNDDPVLLANSAAVIVDALRTKKANLPWSKLIERSPGLLRWRDAGSGDLLLHVASANGNVDVVRCLLDFDATLVGEASRVDGRTALHRAAECGHVAVAKVLRERGVSVDAVSRFGRTALHDAAQANQLAMVNWLLEKGAQRNIVDESGHTPLLLAAMYASADVVRALLNAGANDRMMAHDGKTALVIAQVAIWCLFVRTSLSTEFTNRCDKIRVYWQR